LNAANTCVLYLEGCFAHQTDRKVAFAKFACGMFSTWQPFLMIDPVLQSLEDENLMVNSDEAVSADHGVNRVIDFLQYPVGKDILASRPLPIARRSICGKLIPSRLMLLRGMALTFLFIYFNVTHYMLISVLQ
jgi:hypothetical protein